MWSMERLLSYVGTYDDLFTFSSYILHAIMMLIKTTLHFTFILNLDSNAHYKIFSL